ncbi:hypothetical protein ABE17_06350 [Bacillus mycoides]|uniref:DUF1819 family protein n=1 Tax=Bacillus mycoides TaxID=1405 RepID=UPI0018CF5269|nr:DUF1819 family protein [Bacillus mycoides]MBG9596521.1 hypothetical protein [Bacillus mycoides]
MTIESMEYSSSLNGAAFLLFELKQVAKLKLEGFSDKEIRDRVKAENLFQFESTGRTKRTLSSIMKRVATLDEKLCELLLTESNDVARVINLYAIMKTDRLFMEFMEDVISEKLMTNNFLLEKKDLNGFFRSKEEQSEKIASFSELNVEKLKRAIMQVLFEAGILTKRQSGEINRIVLDSNLKEHLLSNGEQRYIRAFGE